MMWLLLAIPFGVGMLKTFRTIRTRWRLANRAAMWCAIDRGIRRGEDPHEVVRRVYVPFSVDAS
jgi:hypothetical protein